MTNTLFDENFLEKPVVNGFLNLEDINFEYFRDNLEDLNIQNKERLLGIFNENISEQEKNIIKERFFEEIVLRSSLL